MKKETSKKKWIYTLIAIIILGTAFIIRKETHKQEPILGKAQKGNILEAVYGIGTVTATRTYELKVGITSTIRELYVREGDQVTKGQKLLALDGAGIFVAPFSGTVTALPTKIGETIFPQTSILTLTDLKDRYLLVSLEQQAATRVHTGLKAKLSFDSLREKSFNGEVESVYSQENNYLVRINTKDLPPQILPGMTVDVAIGIKEHLNALIVPIAAINSGKLWIIRNGKKMKVSATVGTVDGNFAEIITGDIKENDTILEWRN